VGIIPTLSALEMLLVIEKRRRLHMKNAKSAQGGVFDAVLCVRPWFAMVGQLLNPSIQYALECIEV
jgi:hypothetical protein